MGPALRVRALRHARRPEDEEEVIGQSVITTLLPTEHMVPTHSDFLYERAMGSLHLVVSSGRARTSG